MLRLMLVLAPATTHVTAVAAPAPPQSVARRARFARPLDRKDRADTEESLRKSATSYFAAVGRVDFAGARTLVVAAPRLRRDRERPEMPEHACA